MLKRFALGCAALVLASSPAFAQEGTSTADLPRTQASSFRIAPVLGASSFTVNNEVSTENFDDGFSAGLFADFGSGTWNFETGIVTLQSNGDAEGGTGAFNVETWGIPLLAKFNFSGKPHSTVFLKAGAMPYTATGDGSNDFDIMAVGGIGGNIPLGRNSSLLLDASYNRLFTENGDVTDLQGIALLAGLSFNI